METNMTPSNVGEPTTNQAEKLSDRIQIAGRKKNIDTALFQVALGYPGTGLEDEIGEVLMKYANKARGILKPVRAQDTGLVPEGWTVDFDELEGDVDLTKLDFSYCPVNDNDKDGLISGDTMLKRAKQIQAIGSLGFAKLVLDAQKEGKDVIPPELRGKVYIICSRTGLRDSYRGQHVPFLHWGGERWVLHFSWLDFSRFFRHVRLPRVRE